MEHARNSSEQPAFLLVYGFITLPSKYGIERDVVMTLVGLMALVSVVANAMLLLVIAKDPFKQLRTITATLLAFNSTANLCISFVLLLDSAFYWNHGQFSPELVVYLIACSANLYFIGNLLHTVNIYGAIVVPVRYAYLAPRVRKILVQALVIIWIFVSCLIIIPPYALPDQKLQSYLKGILTFVCVQLALLTLTFIYLYSRIFQALYARKRRLEDSFQVKSTSPQGLKIMKKNYEVAKTLFIHVLFFVISTSPGSIIFMVFLHCTGCSDPTTLQMAALFAVPFVYTSFVFHPFLWLSRLSTYRQAMKQTLSFRRSQTYSTTITNNTVDNKSGSTEEIKQGSDSLTSAVTPC